MYDKGQKAEPADNLKRGQSHVYPYDENNPKGPKRTQTNYAQNLNQASLLKKEVNGVKGPCPLFKLKYFCPIRSTAIDYMHSLCEGNNSFFKRYRYI